MAVGDATVGITEHKVIVAFGDRIALAAPFEDIRRVELDIERNQATLILVSTVLGDEPQMLTVDGNEAEAVGHLAVEIGLRLVDQQERYPQTKDITISPKRPTAETQL
jgi:hypothetical protein